MLKFLRKYNKVILVLGGCVLMVAFTLPQLPSLVGGTAFSRKVASIEGEAVRGAAFNEIRTDFQIIQQVIGPSPLGIQDTDHYMLLRHEAEKYGFIGGRRDGAAVIDRIADITVRSQRFAQFMPQQQLDEQTQQVAEFLDNQRRRVITGSAAGNADAVDNALATLHGIIRLLSANAQFVPASRPEAVDTARRLFDRAVVDIAIIPTGSTEAAAANATPEQLRAFFDQHATTPAAEDPYGISYLRPDAIALEYVLISKPAVEQLITIDSDLPVRRFYDSLPEAERTELGDTWQQAREPATQRYRSTRADEIIGDAAAAVRSYLQNTRRTLQLIDEDDDPRLDLPSDWPQQRPSLDDVAARILERLPEAPPRSLNGEQPPQPVVTRSNPARFYTQREIRSGRPANDPDRQPEDTRNDITFLSPFRAANVDGEFNAARVLFTTAELTPTDLAERPADIPENYTPQTRLFFDRPITNIDGSIIFVRPIDVRPESPPPSWTDIEQQVREDFAKVTIYERNLGLKDDFALALVEGGLEALAAAYPDVSTTLSGAVVTRNNVFRSAQQTEPFPPANTPDFRNAVMDIVSDWPPDTDPQQDIPPAQRALAVGIPRRFSVAAARITNRWPVTEEQFIDNAARVLAELNRQATQQTGGQSFFSFDAVAERLDYQDLLEN